MGTRVLELDTIQYPSASTENIQVGNNSVTFPSGISVDINGGAIDGTPVGAGYASTGAFTTLSTTGTATLPTVNIDGGNIDGTPVGAATPSTGAFTTLSSTGAATLPTVDINGGNIDGATIATSNITVGSGKTLDGAGTFNISSGSLTTSTSQKQAIVDGATIEAQDLATGSGTTLPSQVQDNITRLGSVSSGHISHTVSMTGVPKRKKIKYLGGSNQGTHNNYNTNHKIVCLGTISYPVLNGNTYLITANFEEFTQDGGSGTFGEAYYGIMYGTTNRSNNDFAVDTELIKRTSSYGSYDSRSRRATTLMGAYT